MPTLPTIALSLLFAHGFLVNLLNPKTALFF
jgi:threonine/homoserine/homoserine lactone efflux protein